MLNITRKRISLILPLSGVRLGAILRNLVAVTIVVAYLAFAAWVLLGTYKQQIQSVPSTGFSVPPQLDDLKKIEPDWSSWFWSSAPADWVLVLVGVLTGYIAIRTLLVLQDQVRAAIVSSKASIRAANSARASAEAAKASADAVVLAERAYVSMSHVPPGLVPGVLVGGVLAVNASVAVQNKGSTPARVINAELFAHQSTNPLPDEPPYGIPTDPPSSAYLVKDEQFYVSGTFNLTQADWAQIQASARTLWLLGYVDYIDVFDQRHRAGYARRYAPTAPPGNNLPFETKAGYNYDKPLT
jgi:hypothetical protein